MYGAIRPICLHGVGGECVVRIGHFFLPGKQQMMGSFENINKHSGTINAGNCFTS
jgi:hypothetical protein